MARTVLVAGTASHVGKSTVAAGLCRLLADRGVDVAPFKAQNMSNNARAVPCPTRDVAAGDRSDSDWGEIGVSQFVQARAARTEATTDANPVLLKPRGDGESQVLLQGRPVGSVAPGTYYEDHWDLALRAAEASYERLAAAHDVVVAEGAGSIAEPNLRERDLANVETARFADAEVVLVADIARGGAFASVVGALELATDPVRERVAGVLITKFRGDESLLAPAVDELETRTGVPVLGVVPHEDPGLPQEDSVSLPPEGGRGVRGDDGVPPEGSVTVGVPRLPHISNATDLEPLAREPGVRVAYLPPEASLAGVDGLVVPGTKNTVDDLLALREGGLGDAIAAFEGPVVGLCGGYQLLGRHLHGVAREGTDSRAARDSTADSLPGLDRLPVETTFHADKRIERVTRDLEGAGPLAGASGTVTGYEIHAGRTDHLEATPTPVGPESAVRGQVLGTYLHDLFTNDAARRAFVTAVFAAADREPPETWEGPDDAGRTRDPYDAAARLLADHVDLSPLDAIPEVARA